MTAQTIENLQARLDIQDVLTRYTVALDTRDLEMFQTVFTEATRFDYGQYGQGTGISWFTEWVQAGMEACKSTYHVLGQSLIEIDGASARGRTYLVAHHIGRDDFDDELFTVAGWHIDRFGLTNEGWRITERGFVGAWTQGDSRVLTG